MMRNRPWKLFSGKASAGALPPASNTASRTEAGLIGTSDLRGLSSAAAEPAQGAGAVFAGFTEPVMVLDLEGRIVAANEPAVMLGQRLGAPLDKGMRIEPLLAKARLINGGGSPAWSPVPDGLDTLLAPAERLAGEEIFELRSTARNGADGRPAGWVVRLIDVARLVAALDGERVAAGHRDRLLKLLSHDMRTPLAAILAILKHPDFATTPTHLKDIIEGAAHRALTMVDSNVRLIRAQCAEYRFVELDFCHVVEEAIDSSWSLARESGVRIVLEPTDVPSPISADRGYLMEGLSELFANIIDRGVPSGIVLCGLSPSIWHDKPAVTLNIRDTVARRPPAEGYGISDGATEATDNQPLPLDKGAGLDLLKTVVTRHCGVMSCESEEGLIIGVSVTIPSVDPALQPS